MRQNLRGGRPEVQTGLRQYEDLGVPRFVVMLIANRLGPDNFESELQRIAESYI